MRGMNLGNALEAPKEGAWGVTLDVAHFEAYSKEGFDHVRMPVKFSAHIDKSAPFTVEPSFFARVDWAIDQALSHNLSIIVDLHHYDELINEPDTHVEPFLAIWKQIAERYKGRPKTVAFELLNEPHDNLKPDKLNRILNDAIKAIRSPTPIASSSSIRTPGPRPSISMSSTSLPTMPTSLQLSTATRRPVHASGHAVHERGVPDHAM